MRPRRRGWRLAGGLLAGALAACGAPREAPPDTERWEPDITAFEASDRSSPPAPGGVVFVGSSSIRLWETLEQDFPGVAVVKRGFGGSEMSDVLRYVDRIVLPYRPEMVVVYAGDNDLWVGEAPERIAGEFRALVREIHEELPDTRVAFIAVKPSVARWRIEGEIRRTNELIREFAEEDPRVEYIDIFTPMLGSDGRPRPELFVEDGLHLNPRGYEVWKAVVAPFMEREGARSSGARRTLLARR
jgi:lysophospholipase L1-like esterase